MVRGQWYEVNGPWSMVRGPWSVVSGQRSVVDAGHDGQADLSNLDVVLEEALLRGLVEVGRGGERGGRPRLLRALLVSDGVHGAWLCRAGHNVAPTSDNLGDVLDELMVLLEANGEALAGRPHRYHARHAGCHLPLGRHCQHIVVDLGGARLEGRHQVDQAAAHRRVAWCR